MKILGIPAAVVLSAGLIVNAFGFQGLPSEDQVRKETRRLEVEKDSLFAGERDFQNKTQMFIQINLLDLWLTKYASAENIPETQSRRWIVRLLSLCWLKHLINWATWGGVERAGDFAADHLSSHSYIVLGTAEQKKRRSDVLRLMSEEKYDDAREVILRVDPQTVKRAQAAYIAGHSADAGADLEFLRSPCIANGTINEWRDDLRLLCLSEQDFVLSEVLRHLKNLALY